MLITLKDYWMGRDTTYPLDMTPEIEHNAEILLGLVNLLLTKYGGTHPHVTSGWRPPRVNATTPGAAKFSRHMTGQAIDLEDHDGLLDDWLMSDQGLLALQEIGLWLEHPAATKGWTHLQSMPPASKRRVFYP
ncbi:MAG: D-Ala-D-Ala carboxypeptidase family metallohydrolase [Vicinamibacterales bacterium]